MADNFITTHFFEIWGICSLIVLIGAFVLNYLDFKEDGFLELSIKDIFWGIVFILLGPITILTVIVAAIVKIIEDFVYSDFWKNKFIVIKKKEKKNEEENEN